MQVLETDQLLNSFRVAALGAVSVAAAMSGCTPHVAAHGSSVQSERSSRLVVTRSVDGSLLEVEDRPGHHVIDGIALTALLGATYELAPSQVSGVSKHRDVQLRVFCNCPITPHTLRALLPQALESELGIRVALSRREFDALVVRLPESDGGGPPVSTSPDPCVFPEPRAWVAHGVRIKDVCSVLAARTGMPVIDQSGLSDLYDVSLRLPKGVDWRSESAPTVLAEQLGLRISRELRVLPALSVHEKPR